MTEAPLPSPAFPAGNSPRTLFLLSLIPSGGETSGAVTLALALQAFDIGPSIAPGVPILRPTERPGMQLVLKSGNFGEEDFFLKTLV